MMLPNHIHINWLKMLFFGVLFLLLSNINSYGQIDSLYDTENGTNEFTHLIFHHHDDSATLLCNSYDFAPSDSDFYSHLVVYRLSLKTGALRELKRFHKNYWDIYTTYQVSFEPDSNKLMYLTLDTAERENGKYKQQYYVWVNTSNDWESVSSEKLAIPFQKYFIWACHKGQGDYVFTGDTTNIVEHPSFFARIDKNNARKILKVYPFSSKVGSILPIEKNYLLSGAIFNNPYGSRFHLLVDSLGEEIWRVVYEDSALDYSGFFNQGVAIGNRYYHIGYKYIRSKSKAIGILNCVNEKGELVFEKNFDLAENTYFYRLIFRNGFLYAAARIDTIELNGQTSERIVLMKFNPTDGHLLWYQNYHYGKQSIHIHNLYETSSGLILIGEGINPKRLPEFDTTHYYEDDGWFLMVDSNGCIVPGCKPNLLGGVQQILTDGSILSVNPNPAGDVIHLQLMNAHWLDQVCFIGLYDINGVELYGEEMKLTSPKFQIKSPPNHHGFAILALRIQGGTYYKKILIQ